ncbi:cyclin-dependent protein kinase inhibitor SMR6 [Sorghum bicolor]|jgi:hypothetical protein|uniref:Uncharacterized protein n=1 Tax=Sorghum bicolor TaxID=4558 RepID=C5XTV1_SORBI|nr:cyclin-dependent protein kinase inhibitor SMR6 [Sorghum bicolor]EES06235.2 hypothetical protein SORBI_3004G030300 [Sorghum bicolor]|eukprot:XP_002451481.2 cyclin-dependent protein kinase inhibitor SMR6 [Sorghum bicolor]
MMGLPEVKKKKQLVHSTRVEDRHRHHQKQQHQDGSKVKVLDLSSGAGIAALPLQQQLKPVKTSRRRHAAAAVVTEEEGEGEEEPVTPRGEGWRIPAEAATCPPAPKKPRTAVSIVRSTAGRRCNYDGGEVFDEFFRVPADLEAVFVARAAKAN